MTIQTFETYDFYYDEEGDFLEVIFGESPDEGYSEEIEPGVFIHRVEGTDKIYGIGILSFKKRCYLLKELLKRYNLNFPLNISYSG